MKTEIRVVLLLLAYAAIAAAREPKVKSTFRKDVHVLMYETDSSLEKDPISPLHFFKERSNIANLKTTIFGGDLAYHGFGDKYQTLRPLLELLDQTKLVILADARDVALNVPEDPEAASRAVDQFMETYRKLTKDAPNAIVMSAESQCCVSAMSHAHPGDFFDPQTMKRQSRACASGTEGCLWDENENIYSWVQFMYERAFNDTGIDYIGDVYLNAGLMAGYPKDLMKLLDTIDIGPSEDDQAVLSGLMYSFPDMIVLDYDQEMFGNNQWPRGLEGGCVFETKDSTSRLVHRETGTEPLIVHTPGKFYGCLDVLIEELGGTSNQRYLETHPEGNPRRTGRRRLRKDDDEDGDPIEKDDGPGKDKDKPHKMEKDDKDKKEMMGEESKKTDDDIKKDKAKEEDVQLEMDTDEKGMAGNQDEMDGLGDSKPSMVSEEKPPKEQVDDASSNEMDSSETDVDSNGETVSNYGQYGQYGGQVLGQYGDVQYGQIYGVYGNYGAYGNYGNYGAYGNYGNYGNYGAYGNYGYGVFEEEDDIFSFFGRRRRIRQAYRGGGTP